MMSPEVHRSYSFVSTLVPLPPEQAAIAYDFALAHLGLDGRLVVDGPLRRVVPGGPYRALRSAAGRLHTGRRVRCPVPVSLELLPWSDDRCELALAPTSRRRSQLGERQLAAYGQAADYALMLFATLMLAPPPSWLEAILARGGPAPARRAEVMAVR